MSGAPRNYWTFRFEAKHKEFKSYAISITSRINLPVSLAIKYQFQFAHELMQPPDSLFLVHEMHRIHISEKISSFGRNNYNAAHPTITYSQCTYFGHLYKSGFYLCVDSLNLAVFQIRAIAVVSKSLAPFVVGSQIELKEYHHHYLSYEIRNYCGNYDGDNIHVFPINTFTGVPFNSHIINNGLKMIRIPESF